MLTVSPPVSPSVVARILMIQKPSVIAGTLLRAAERLSVIGFLSQSEPDPQSPRRRPFHRSTPPHPGHDQRIGNILRASDHLQATRQRPGCERVQRGGA